MEVWLNLWTNSACLVIFDPALYEASGPLPYPFTENKDIQEGRFAFVQLQGDQTFRVRITDSSLTARELELLNETLGPAGLLSHSGQAYVSGMDLPGNSVEVYAKHGAGSFIALESDAYTLYFHELDLECVSSEEYKELPDYVIELHRRDGPFPGIPTELSFSGGRQMERFLEQLDANGRE